jgi:hypothetical protein
MFYKYSHGSSLLSISSAFRQQTGYFPNYDKKRRRMLGL